MLDRTRDRHQRQHPAEPGRQYTYMGIGTQEGRLDEYGSFAQDVVAPDADADGRTSACGGRCRCPSIRRNSLYSQRVARRACAASRASAPTASATSSQPGTVTGTGRRPTTSTRQARRATTRTGTTSRPASAPRGGRTSSPAPADDPRRPRAGDDPRRLRGRLQPRVQQRVHRAVREQPWPDDHAEPQRDHRPARPAG